MTGNAYSSNIPMGPILIAAVIAILVALVPVLVLELSAWLIKGFESIWKLAKVAPLSVQVHYFLRDGVGHALLSRVVKT